MPRKPRFYLPDIPVHVVQRGNCRRAVFYCREDYERYLDWLEKGADKYGCQLHAYVLMTNHVHLLMTPDSRESVSKTIQFVGRNYVTYINRRYHKSGTLWEGRHKGCLVAEDGYFLTCMRYIELNPVRAGMVRQPEGYCWSSFRDNTSESRSGFLTPHACYQALGQNRVSQANSYKALVKSALDQERVQEIRAAVQTGTPLGNDRFRTQVESILRCRVGRAQRGRPDKGY